MAECLRHITKLSRDLLPSTLATHQACVKACVRACDEAFVEDSVGYLILCLCMGFCRGKMIVLRLVSFVGLRGCLRYRCYGISDSMPLHIILQKEDGNSLSILLYLFFLFFFPFSFLFFSPLLPFFPLFSFRFFFSFSFLFFLFLGILRYCLYSGSSIIFYSMPLHKILHKMAKPLDLCLNFFLHSLACVDTCGNRCVRHFTYLSRRLSSYNARNRPGGTVVRCSNNNVVVPDFGGLRASPVSK